MGCSAIHTALECALETYSSLSFIGEEVRPPGMTSVKDVEQIVDVVMKRAKMGINYGFIVLPEELVEFMLDGNSLIADLSELQAHCDEQPSRNQVASNLSDDSSQLFERLSDASRCLCHTVIVGK